MSWVNCNWLYRYTHPVHTLWCAGGDLHLVVFSVCLLLRSYAVADGDPHARSKLCARQWTFAKSGFSVTDHFVIRETVLATGDAGIVSELLCATVARRRNEYISASGALCMSLTSQRCFLTSLPYIVLLSAPEFSEIHPSSPFLFFTKWFSASKRKEVKRPV